MNTFFVDLRHALRSLMNSPGFTLTAVLTLALGIGANTAIFSLVDRVMLRPLPFPESQRLMAVTATNIRETETRDNLSPPDFMDWQRESTQFSGLAALRNTSMNLTGDGEPELVRVGRVSGNFFDVLQVQPMLGRRFQADEDRAEGPMAVVLSHGLWERRFEHDATLVGRSIRLDGVDRQVVGVLPKDFEFAHKIKNSDVFVPMGFSKEELADRGSHFLSAVGRLKPGATQGSAAKELKAIAARLEKAYPDSNTNFTAKVLPLKDQITRNFRGTLFLLLAAVGFVLLIACANVANLLLARGTSREREMAVRTALGANRRRLMQQLLTESLLLGLLGAAAGLLLTSLCLNGLGKLLPIGGPATVSFDGRMLAFTFALSLLTALIFGSFPALQASQISIGEGLKEGSRGTTNPVQRRLRGALVASEVALATVLLVGAGLMVHSLWHLQHVHPGFQEKGVLTALLRLPKAKYPDAASQQVFTARLQTRIEAIPGVTFAAATDTLPLGGSTRSSSYDIQGVASAEESLSAINHRVTPGYFTAMGIPILRGRDFQATESHAMIISDRFAKQHWGAKDPLGASISMDGPQGPWHQVVGVVGDVRHEGLGHEPEPEFYRSMLDPEPGADKTAATVLVVKGQRDPLGYQAAIKSALKELDPDLPLYRIQSLSQIMIQDRADPQARVALFGAFAAIALLLASIGIYGVTSFLVAQRAREIGIRMALGAQVQDVLRLVMAQGFRMVGLGMAAGLLCTLALGRLLQSQLTGMKPLDPITYGAVVLLLSAIALLACLLPALKATKVDPMIALRSE